jgi:N-acetyl-alpha-D-glucosaminyl L-malate synthase BshA
MREEVVFHPITMRGDPLLQGRPYDLALAARLAELHEQRGVRLVHAHYALPHALSALLADLCVGRGTLKTVTTLHGTDITLVGSDPAYHRIVRLGLESSTRLTAVSQSLAEETRRIFGEDLEIEVVPNFLPPWRFPKEGGLRVFPRWEKKAPVLVHLSTFRSVKRVRDLVVALKLVRRILPVSAVLVGEGPDRASAEALVQKLGLQRNVRFAGSLEDPSAELRRGDLYLFSSRTESFGLGLLEAMSHGLPVVGPCVGGVPEVVGEAGVLVSPSRPLALAEGVLALLSNPKRYEACSRLAFERAEKLFSRERVLPRWLKIFEDLAE